MMSYLHISTSLVRHLHDELAAFAIRLADQVMQDVQVDGGSQIVDVGHKDVLLALRDQLIQQARVVEAGVDVAVTGRVPALCVLPSHAQGCGHGKERLFVDARVPGQRERKTSQQQTPPQCFCQVSAH